MNETESPLPTEAADKSGAPRLGRWLVVASATLVAMLFWIGLAASTPGNSSVGTPAPDFSLPLLDPVAGLGVSVSKSDFAGRVTVVNVWASWCGPCREEAPTLRRAHAAADPRLVAFLGVVRNDDLDDARGFIADFGIEYANAIDDDAFASDYGVRGLPMTFVLDAAGTITAAHFGPISESRLRVLIENAMARSAAP